MRPCRVARPAFFAAPAMPRLRNTTSASPTSPFVSTRAFLHSIMPAPVRWRSSLTNAAVISAIIPALSDLARPRDAAPELLVSALFDRRLGLGFGFGGGSLTLRRRSGLFFHAQALGHDLLGVLGVHVFGIGRHVPFDRRFVADDLVGGEILFGGESAALDHGVRNLAGE